MPASPFGLAYGLGQGLAAVPEAYTRGQQQGLALSMQRLQLAEAQRQAEDQRKLDFAMSQQAPPQMQTTPIMAENPEYAAQMQAQQQWQGGDYQAQQEAINAGLERPEITAPKQIQTGEETVERKLSPYEKMSLDMEHRANLLREMGMGRAAIQIEQQAAQYMNMHRDQVLNKSINSILYGDTKSAIDSLRSIGWNVDNISQDPTNPNNYLIRIGDRETVLSKADLASALMSPDKRGQMIGNLAWRQASEAAKTQRTAMQGAAALERTKMTLGGEVAQLAQRIQGGMNPDGTINLENPTIAAFIKNKVSNKTIAQADAIAKELIESGGMDQIADTIHTTGQLPTGLSRNAMLSAKAYSYYAQKYPDDDLGEVKRNFAAQMQATKAFAPGSLENRNITSVATAVGHLNHMDELITALDNKDVAKINRIANMLKTQLNLSSAPNNFDALRAFVAAEVAKVAKGGAITDAEEKHIKSILDSGLSGDILKNAISQFKYVMKSRVDAMQEGYAFAYPGRSIYELMPRDVQAFFGQNVTPRSERSRQGKQAPESPKPSGGSAPAPMDPETKKLLEDLSK